MEVLSGHLAIDDLDAFLGTIDTIGDRHGATIQAFDADYVAGRRHLVRAVEAAERAVANDDAIARDPAVEILLYAAGRRQIDRALEMGVDEGEGPAVIVVSGGDESAAVADLHTELALEDGAVLGARDDATLRAFFDITEREEAATDASVQELVCERVALLAVVK
ncbi:KEOPS complex subunit Cgi121 [Halovivax cerinus]|uniref:KEOPS complex subunit Cgi121 n=1 Tax=Halovivax cerinus TaxID=1487865 RepID=A0ABD5NSU2_9EURY|nr:KEOPS complex subunit Cgi121 [Halovivax cerinus]